MLEEKIIKRGKYPPIRKKEIDVANILKYEDIDMSIATTILNEVISDPIYNTIDLLKLLEINYNGDMREAIDNIKDYSEVRFNCYYATRLLKSKLANIGIGTMYLSYKSIGFSTDYGDSLIKEAHTSLILPTIRDGRIYYILFDPGLRIPEPIGFYQEKNSELLLIDNDEILITHQGELEYPYSMNMRGYNRYSTRAKIYECIERFDTKYETLNPEEILFPISYEILDGYRVINYNTSYNMQAYIKLMVIDEYLECFDINGKVIITYNEIIKLYKKELIFILKKYTDKLNINVYELVDIIYFMIKNRDEFKNLVINPNVLEEKTK